MNWRKMIAVAAALLVILLCFAETTSAQCPMCRTALINSPEGQEMATGFNYGILFLLGTPFLVVGTIALLIFQAHRRYRPFSG